MKHIVDDNRQSISKSLALSTMGIAFAEMVQSKVFKIKLLISQILSNYRFFLKKQTNLNFFIRKLNLNGKELQVHF